MPIPQLETQGAVPPEVLQHRASEKEGGQTAGFEQQVSKGGLHGLLGRLTRAKKPRGREHVGFAPPGQAEEQNDELRALPPSLRRTPVTRGLKANRSYLNQAFGLSWDIVYRDLLIGTDHREALVVYIDGLVNKDAIQEFVIKPLTLEANMAGVAGQLSGMNPIQPIQGRVVSIGELRTTDDLAEVVDRVCGGETILLVDGLDQALVMDTRGWKDRAVTEPQTEVTVRGPREGFTETLKTSTALLRHRLKTPFLRYERLVVGDYTRTDVVLAYIEGLASQDLLREVRTRLNRIKIDSFIESKYIEELIKDEPWSLFPLIQATEYPERVAAALVEGRVAIMADTTPFVLILPTTFVSFLHSAEDHFQSPVVASFLRIVRAGCILIGLWGSAVYVAVVTFHPELVPSPLLERLVTARRGVPFGLATEILILELAFEVLREAGVRLPRPVGQAVSIVGALVLGDAAVRAGLVSPAAVIVVAFAAICSLSLPNYWISTSMRLLRYPLILLAAAMGLFGVSVGTTVILAHLTSLRSFGTPYLAPVAPFMFRSLVADGLLRAPLWAAARRSPVFSPVQLQRQAGRQGPRPQAKTGDAPDRKGPEGR